ncbi:Fc receptor-like protein 5 isoform X1 [Poecilia latipinna]|uniref:Fc receptor-like protein 5 isoform X1 n=1 Tax=Poecilia latipinna TaxID=48699 RepID=UPI00072DF1C1|nr:PREDICTED: Fc receptor-like protein 5 isoform X1 [Poecilia latipinna]
MYELFRRSSFHDSETFINISNGVFNITEGGIYRCRGFTQGFFTPVSDDVTIKETVSNRVSVTMEPNWSQIYRGEKVTLRCEIRGGGGAQWTYEWRPNRNSPSSREYKINSATASDSGEYSCMAKSDYKQTQWSDAFRLSVLSEKPRATVTADNTIIPAGGSVTLRCSVENSAGWRIYWFRQDFESSRATDIKNNKPDGTIRVSDGGLYSCRGERGDPVFYTDTSTKVTIQKTVKPTVILQPNWPQIYIGEKVTLKCEIQDGRFYYGTKQWRKNNSVKPGRSQEYMIISASESDSGDYSCRAEGDRFSLSVWSDVFTLVVSEKPKATVKADNTIIPAGGSVTLRCSVDNSADWRIYWFKRDFESSRATEIKNNKPDGTIRVSDGGLYSCRGERGDPVFYTETSREVTIQKTDKVSVSPSWLNPGASVTLSCEGNSAEWRVKRFIETGKLSDCSNWGRMTGSTCTINRYWSDSGVYWCESRSGEFSNAVNITVQDDDSAPLLLSPVHPVTEGDPVTLSCRDKTQQLLSNVFFYHNDKLLHNDSREELKISAVSKSDEGFYKCQHSGKDSPRSWMSVRVTVSSPVSSSFPVMLIVGPVVGVVLFILIILLLLLWCCRRSKGLWCIRSKQAEGRGQTSNTNHGVNNTEDNDYRSPPQDNTNLYASVKSSEATGNAADEPRDVTYSHIELKDVDRTRRPREAEESAVYSEVKLQE